MLKMLMTTYVQAVLVEEGLLVLEVKAVKVQKGASEVTNAV